MEIFLISLILTQVTRLASGTCVLESDFGFILNCNLKKSGLFRVRNLGGLKAHFGLGFSFGDELGFAESLGNLDGGRRRAINNYPLNYVGVLPASQQSPAEKYLISRSTVNSESVMKRASDHNSQLTLMTDASSLPLGVPVFRPIPQFAESTAERRKYATVNKIPVKAANKTTIKKLSGEKDNNANNYLANMSVNFIPMFQEVPLSISRISSENTVDDYKIPQDYSVRNYATANSVNHTVEEATSVAKVNFEAVKHATNTREKDLKADLKPTQALNPNTIKRKILSTGDEYSSPLTLQEKDENTYLDNNVSKVMNAPKEYYPAGYDKNYDDNFRSKVVLPSTTFTCEKQKHFPGLYADMGLGCMVFHVCALTNDGFVKKSFVCPESTLFDQTILKCNWWFYVDCLTSNSIYDSNIPISKSYQLMKSLTYFSKYSKSN